MKSLRLGSHFHFLPVFNFMSWHIDCLCFFLLFLYRLGCNCQFIYVHIKLIFYYLLFFFFLNSIIIGWNFFMVKQFLFLTLVVCQYFIHHDWLLIFFLNYMFNWFSTHEFDSVFWWFFIILTLIFYRINTLSLHGCCHKSIGHCSYKASCLSFTYLEFPTTSNFNRKAQIWKF